MRNEKYLPEELVEILREETEELGRTPTVGHFEESMELPSPMTFKNRFGEWNNAVWRAGLDFNQEKYGKEELLDQLRQKSREMDVDVPTIEDIREDSDMPGYSTYRKEFGSYEELLEEAGMVMPDTDNSRFVDEEEIYAAWEESMNSREVAEDYGVSEDLVQEIAAEYALI